jgi:hypothetical protein
MAAEGAAAGEGPTEDGGAHLPAVVEPQAVEAAAPF